MRCDIRKTIMTDNHTSAQRSYNMSRIRSKDTKPEERVRKELFSRGFRYRKNVKELPGKPDIVLKKYNTVVFVNGCFWHMHDCGRFTLPKTNLDYWKEKLQRNVKRDSENEKKLRSLGWKVIVIWECQLNKDRLNKTIDDLCFEITSNEARKKNRE